MNKIILYIACSIDGMIARENGSVDWLDQFSNTSEDYGYHEFYKKIKNVILGNKTYKQVLTFGEYPYKDKKSFIFSRKENSDDRFVKDTDFIKDLKGETWLVGGSILIEEFLKKNLIDEFIISVMPLVLGKGIPLFRNMEVDLKLIDVVKYDSGVVQLKYIRKTF
jgi:dihydrofolate reductase